MPAWHAVLPARCDEVHRLRQFVSGSIPLGADGQQAVNLSCTMMSTITVELMDGKPVNRDGGGLSSQIAARVYDRIGRFQDTQKRLNDLRLIGSSQPAVSRPPRRSSSWVPGPAA